MSRFALIVFASVLVAVAVAPMVESGVFGDFMTKFMDNGRAPKCGHIEIPLEGKISIKELNDPKPPCERQCKNKDLDHVKGDEQVIYGPGVICCCKAQEKKPEEQQ